MVVDTYDLVAIGDQCWFAENLRNEHYANGDAIPGELSDGEWSARLSGAMTVLERVHRLFTEVTMQFPTLLTTAACTTGTRWMTRVGCVQAVGTSRLMGST